MKTYLIDDKQEIFIRLLLAENFSPSFGGMLKRVLKTRIYNESERTRIKEIRLSYIKKKIIPMKSEPIMDAINANELFNKKLHYCNMLFEKYGLDDTTKQMIINRFDKLTTNKEFVKLYNYYVKQFK